MNWAECVKDGIYSRIPKDGSMSGDIGQIAKN